MTPAERANYTEIFLNPSRSALHSDHAPMALRHGRALKYPAAIAPFAVLSEDTPAAVLDLLPLLEPAETTYLTGDTPPPTPPEAHLGAPVGVHLMVFPENHPEPATEAQIAAAQLEPMTAADAPAMLDLITIAFPGYFRPRTHEMGRYYGVRDPQNPTRLIAMGGERQNFTTPEAAPQHPQQKWRELSGVAVLAEARGRGLATAIMAQLIRDHRAEAARSWLWVLSTNTRAIDLYLHQGFEYVREMFVHPIRKA